jgi:hypothetical protein
MSPGGPGHRVRPIAGFSVKTSATLEVSAKPHEIILDNLDNLTGGSRAEFRRSQGIPDNMPTPALAATHALPAGDNAVLDAEILTEGDELIAAMRRQQDHGQPATDARRRRSCGRRAAERQRTTSFEQSSTDRRSRPLGPHTSVTVGPIYLDTAMPRGSA